VLGNKQIPADVFGWTPYHYTCLLESELLTRYLLHYSETKTERLGGLLDKLHRSPIHIAALGGIEINLEAIFSRLNDETKNIIIQTGGLDGMTPIHLVSRSGGLACLQWVLPRGEASKLLAKKDVWGRQALHIASKYGQDEIAVKLLEMGSRTDQVDNIGKTPVDYFLGRRKWKRDRKTARRQESDRSLADALPSDESASKTQYMSQEDSELFLKFAMEDPRCRYDHGKTFLHNAMELVQESCIRTLLQQDFDVEAQDDDGRTALHYAILASRASIAEAMIKGIAVNGKVIRANPSAKDSYKTTPLMLAARENLRGVAQALLDSPVPCAINETNSIGETALYYARDLEMVEFLVAQQGRDPLVTTFDGKTALQAAIEHRKQPIALYLLGLKGSGQVQEKPFDNSQESLLVTACKSGCSAIIPMILAKWPEIINIADSYGRTPLAWACDKGDLNIVAILLNQESVDVNRTTTKCNGHTPLHFAAENKNTEIVDLFVKEPSVKLDQQSEDGKTPLQLAFESGCPDVARTLFLNARTFPDGRGLHEVLVRLVGLKMRAVRTTDKIQNANVSAFVAPLAASLQLGAWKELEDPYNLMTLLGRRDVWEALTRQQVDDTGLDEDKWSVVDYIQRFDRKGALKKFSSHLQQSEVNNKDRYMTPTSLLWDDYQESIEVTSVFKA
jgi:ankyrin repeat protein